MLERRRPSLFEPPLDFAPPVSPSIDLVDEQVETASPERSRRRNTPLPTSWTPAEPMRPPANVSRRSITHPPEPHPGHAEPERTIRIERPGATTRIVEATEHTLEVSPLPSRALHEQHETILHPTPQALFAEAARTNEVRAAARQQLRQESEKPESKPAAQSVRERPKPASSPAIDARPAQPPVRVPSVAARQQKAGLPSIPRNLLEPAPEPAPEPPSIQVTIGRIEIRATPGGESTTPAAKPTGPKLKLDDYLRARSGGRS